MKYVFSHLRITTHTYNLQSCDYNTEEVVLRWCWVCFHLSAGAAAMATTDEMLRANHELTWDQVLTSSGPLKIVCQMIQWNYILLSPFFFFFFLPTLTSTDSQLTLWHPYPRAFHLKLESSCPWIILSWDSPRIPRTELSWGRCREEEWSWEPFWGSGVHKCLFWTVSVAWEAWMLVSLCLYMNLTEWGHCTQPHLSIQWVKVRIRVWFKSRVRPQGIDGINKSVWLCSSFCVLTCVHIVTEW